jgi:hypothetical protein
MTEEYFSNYGIICLLTIRIISGKPTKCQLISLWANILTEILYSVYSYCPCLVPSVTFLA